MPITVEFPAEPMTREAASKPANVMKGHAYRRLRSDLVRYCRGEITGRSFVVSGHRGAGKTTLLRALVEDLRATSIAEGDNGHGLRRPFLVTVSAPDLYERPTDPKKKDLPPGDRLLQHLARQLHFAASDEFVRSYGSRAVDVTLHPRVAAEILAAAGQLGMELRAGARLDVIRRFWSVLRAVDRGVLFAEPSTVRAHDQGVRELVALDASAEAYQIAIGKLASERESGSKSETPPGVDWSETLKGAAGPAAALVGSAAGASVATHASFSTTLAASGVGLGLALLLTRSVSAQRSASRIDKSRFEPDTTTGSLAWRLPATIDLFFAAGLAPVFVVDELDKRVP